MHLISCKCCNQPFTIGEEEVKFFERISPSFNEVTCTIPLPTFCPSCRLRRRLAHRNQIYVFYRTVQGYEKPLFTRYFENASFPILTNQEWWSEERWSPESYGRPFDFSRTFFEQFAELRSLVPRPAINSVMNENSEYCNNTGDLKNCYFVFDANTIEDSMYLETCYRVKHSIECSDIYTSELCYDCVGIRGCYNLQSSDHCTECSDSYFLLNCRSCASCFGCTNLSQRRYCIFNEQKTKEEFDRFIASLPLGSWKGRNEIKTRMHAFWNTAPRPHLYGTRCEDVSGNHIHNSRSITESFFISDAERLRYCFCCTQGLNDCQDLSIWGQHAELLYECLICGSDVFHLLFCYNCWNGASELLYCDTCHSSTHLFGCVGMRRRSHCILNKQYSQEEYMRLVPQIITHMKNTGEWGEFFPMTLSHTPYNYSVAHRYFPRTKEESLQEKLWWHEPSREVKGAEAIDATQLPDSLPDSPSPLVVKSEKSSRPFRITSKEIEYYKKFNVPLPRTTYDERMDERKKRMGGVHLSTTTCARTGAAITTTHPLDAPYQVIEKELFDEDRGR